ncbi:hypothetical protein WMY93_018039 [Mugilogobius chulae]|uniref:Thioredoxin-dependent peroxide reductase, mitochondrial n=1 Tax=Mugilogobius chulae TaxID=88201 RepID=A0AAW0NMP6_9GOBI
MAATIGRLLGTSARFAAGGLRAAACQQHVLPARVLQKSCFSTSLSRWGAAVTQPAPAFKATAVHNGEFREMTLEDFKGKYLVLFFYPLDFTFVCPTEIISFSDKASEFHDVNCDVVGVSVDSHFTHLAWINTPRKAGGLGHINIPLLADLNKTDLSGLFIIDPHGVVKHMSVNDLPVGRCVEETLRLVKAFQFVETHGEVCPASWTPESPTALKTERLHHPSSPPALANKHMSRSRERSDHNSSTLRLNNGLNIFLTKALVPCSPQRLQSKLSC